MFCIQETLAIATYREVDCKTDDHLTVLTKDELAQLQASPFNLDPESAMAIGGAMLMVMAVAWLLRMARKTIETLDESE